jgi:hypothetical protein
VTATRQSWTEKERPLAIGSPHHGYQPPCVGFTTFSAVAVILAHGGACQAPCESVLKSPMLLASASG